jgi:tetratricopeptide (TPR) repeat protein
VSPVARAFALASLSLGAASGFALAALSLGAASAFAHPGMHETIERLSERIRETPDEQALWIERGIAYSNDGQFELALTDFRKAETLGDPARVAFDLGVLFYRQGEFEKARESLSRTLTRFPEHALALDYRARAARDAGDARAALADFEALFALRDDVNPGHYLSAAELLVSLPDGGADAALALLDRGLAQRGVIPQLQQRAIALERERGDFGGALQRHDTLAEPLGRSPAWRVERAELLLALERREEAEQELAMAANALAGRRPTPAHAALGERIAELSRRR